MEEIGLVSIVVASYNHEKYIVNCLESIKAQTYSNLELLIADDNSGDKTYELAKKWCEENSKRFVECKIIKNVKNIGITKNFNQLIVQAKGKYIKVMASDDMLFPCFIEKTCEIMKEENYDIVMTNGIRIDDKGCYPIDSRYFNRLLYRSNPFKEGRLYERLLNGNIIAAPAVLFDKKTFEKYGLFDESYKFEDWEYWLRIASQKGKFGYIDIKGVAYRVLNNSASHYEDSEQEKNRYTEFFNEANRMLIKYNNNKSNLDNFYSETLRKCFRQNNKELIKVIHDNYEFELSNKGKFELMLYKLGVFKIYLPIKDYLERIKDDRHI